LALKPQFANFLKLTVVAAGLLMAIGCASYFTGQTSAIRLKVVDARTGEPVPGVTAVWREDEDDLLVGHFQTGPTNLPPSNSGGYITIEPVKAKMVGRLTLSCVGYTTAYGIYSDGSLGTSDNIQPPPMPQDLFTLDDTQTAGKVDGYFLVRMHQ
jgi:hypothetical protein